jgi:hypothetical protein
MLYDDQGKMSPALEQGLKDLKANFKKMLKDLHKDARCTGPVPNADAKVRMMPAGGFFRLEAVLTGAEYSLNPNMLRRGDKVLPPSLDALDFTLFKGDVDEARAARWLAAKDAPMVSWSQEEDRATGTITVSVTAAFPSPK